MNEKKFILSEEQLDKALDFAALGGSGLIPREDTNDMLSKLPEEIQERALSSAIAAAMIRTKGPFGALVGIIKNMDK